MESKSTISRLLEIFLTFFKIGCFTFGGGYAMIPIIEREIITKKGWVTEEDVIDIFAVSESLPGSIAINSSTFVGYKIAKKKGAVAAMFGVLLPSFIIITTIAVFFGRFQDDPAVKAAFLGIRSAVVALIILAAKKMSKVAVKDKITLAVAVAVLILVLIVKIHPIFTIIGGAILGLTIYKLSPDAGNKIVERRNN